MDSSASVLYLWRLDKRDVAMRRLLVFFSNLVSNLVGGFVYIHTYAHTPVFTIVDLATDYFVKPFLFVGLNGGDLRMHFHVGVVFAFESSKLRCSLCLVSRCSAE